MFVLCVLFLSLLLFLGVMYLSCCMLYVVVCFCLFVLRVRLCFGVACCCFVCLFCAWLLLRFVVVCVRSWFVYIVVFVVVPLNNVDACVCVLLVLFVMSLCCFV